MPKLYGYEVRVKSTGELIHESTSHKALRGVAYFLSKSDFRRKNEDVEVTIFSMWKGTKNIIDSYVIKPSSQPAFNFGFDTEMCQSLISDFDSKFEEDFLKDIDLDYFNLDCNSSRNPHIEDFFSSPIDAEDQSYVDIKSSLDEQIEPSLDEHVEPSLDKHASKFGKSEESYKKEIKYRDKVIKDLRLEVRKLKSYISDLQQIEEKSTLTSCRIMSSFYASYRSTINKVLGHHSRVLWNINQVLKTIPFKDRRKSRIKACMLDISCSTKAIQHELTKDYCYNGERLLYLDPKSRTDVREATLKNLKIEQN